jgi:hypothetical protein
LQCCEPTVEERSAVNPHATFCGSRRRATASGDPVGCENGALPNGRSYRAHPRLYQSVGSIGPQTIDSSSVRLPAESSRRSSTAGRQPRPHHCFRARCPTPEPSRNTKPDVRAGVFEANSRIYICTLDGAPSSDPSHHAILDACRSSFGTRRVGEPFICPSGHSADHHLDPPAELGKPKSGLICAVTMRPSTVDHE